MKTNLTLGFHHDINTILNYITVVTSISTYASVELIIALFSVLFLLDKVRQDDGR